MTKKNPLIRGQIYHIYNRGNNRENLFVEKRNYRFFLEKYSYHIMPVAETFAYCLLPNHFHLVVRIRTDEEQQAFVDVEDPVGFQKPTGSPEPTGSPSRQFSNFFNGYTKSFNKTYQRTGKLFEGRFKRKPVTSHRHLLILIAYVHRNPQNHGFVNDFRDWPFSSYRAVLSSQPTRIPRDELLEWFGGPAGFVSAHHVPDEKIIQSLLFNEDDDAA